MSKTNPKILIAPFQELLIKKGMCGGCFANLKECTKEIINEKTEMITCNCRRVYFHSLETDTYRRALLDEI